MSNQNAEAPVAPNAPTPTSSPPSDGASSGGASLGGTPLAAETRQIIYRANVVMEVESYGEAHTELNNLIHVSGGYLLQFSENRTDYEQSGTLTVKVPASGFASFLAQLEEMKPKSIQRSIQGQDVSEQVVDLEARLKSKEMEEERLLDFMSKSTTSADLVAFSAQISQVQSELERIKGQLRYFEQNVAFSTVEIRLYQKISGKAGNEEEGSETAFGARMGKTFVSSLKAVGGFFEGLLVFLAGALPVLAVLAVFAVPAAVLYRRHRRQAAVQTERALELRRQNHMQLEEEKRRGSDQGANGNPMSDDS